MQTNFAYTKHINNIDGKRIKHKVAKIINGEGPIKNLPPNMSDRFPIELVIVETSE